MFSHPFTAFSKENRRLILVLIASHLLWSSAVFLLWLLGGYIDTALHWWSAGFLLLQLYASSQLLLPALSFHPEDRTRGFYFFWGIVFGGSVWGINQLTVGEAWQLPLAVLKSGLLMLVATFVGAALARYVNRLWEIVPICMVMTLADFASWFSGPTADFADQIQEYYLKPEGPAPLIDMVLVKLAFPGPIGLAPVFGISDWIMVAFFSIVAHRLGINDNLIGPPHEASAPNGRIGRYLPISVVALFVAVMLAQITGQFVPALPVIAVLILIWHAARYFMYQQRD